MCKLKMEAFDDVMTHLQSFKRVIILETFGIRDSYLQEFLFNITRGLFKH